MIISFSLNKFYFWKHFFKEIARPYRRQMSGGICQPCQPKGGLRMKRLQFFCFLIIFVLSLVAFGAGTVPAADTIKIGILGPFTGSLAFNGGEMKKGMMLALDEINAGGGLFGQKIELIFGDTECKPDKGLSVVKKLVTQDNVLVVGGGYCSSVNIATSEFCHFEETPVVVAIAISPTVTNRGTSMYSERALTARCS